MNTFQITIQRKSGDYWPVVSEYSRSDVLLPMRSEGKLRLTPDDTDNLIMSLTPKDYGTRLGELLFQGNIGRAFDAARSRSEERLRVLLFIEAEDIEIKGLRWERLCAPIDINGDWNFLRRNQRLPYSLYIPSITSRSFPPIGQRDLRVLLLVASPENSDKFGLARFDVEATVNSIRSALGDKIPCDVLAHGVQGAQGLPTLDNFCEQLTKESYTLLHFVCHGQLLKDIGTVLYWANENNAAEPVKGNLLIDELKNIQGPKGLPHFAFLCTCESASKSAEGAFGGLAEQLVRDLGMPGVVAMTEKITIKTAEALTKPFYEQLRTHGEVDLALSEATAGLSRRYDIIVPALFSRLGGRPLFSDTLDRPLTSAEIVYGLERFEKLLQERAPVLQEEFRQRKEILQRTIGVEVSGLSSESRQERQSALDEVNKLAGEVLDLSFNAVALDKKVPEYDNRCPFRGLYPFRLEDQEFFFGREELIGILQNKLKETTFLAVLGASGSGKSSLVLAGLIPALQKQESDLQWVYMTPKHNPLEQLKTTTAKIQGQPSVLIVDQFEELFTLCTDKELRQTFIKDLLTLVKKQQRIVITMRADFWGECAPYPELKALMQSKQELIAPMDGTQLRTAMESQAAKVGLRFEAGLSNTILDAVEGEPGAMPLLQHALWELWKQRHGRWLRYEEYDKFGGIEKAIATTADDVHGKLLPEEQKLMQNIFVRLTRLDIMDVKRDTRQRVVLGKLLPDGNDLEKTNGLVQRLAGEEARLLVTSVDEKTGEVEVEVAHEALIRYWPRLRGWLESDRENLLLRQMISQQVVEWQEKNDESYLVLRGSRLEKAKELSSQSGILNNQEIAYVRACLGMREQERINAAEQRLKNLSEMGWGVIFAHNEDPKVIAALGELLEHRKEQATRKNPDYYHQLIYRPGETKTTFLNRYQVDSESVDPAKVNPTKVPYYLLIVGDPETIPYYFQYQLDIQYAVGRIHFDNLGDYAHYAHSVVEAEKQQISRSHRVTFFGVKNKGDQGTTKLVNDMIRPLVESIRKEQPNWDVQDLLEEKATKVQLGQLLGGRETPSLIFTGSQGMDFRKGHDRQVTDQGALICQEWPGRGTTVTEQHYFSAKDVDDKAQLYGLIAVFCVVVVLVLRE
jgi:energy-coupling factor transporter ATP-binding protein EcfA2